MAINYQPTQWNNEQEPPISADNLNHIEQGIKATADRVDELVTVEANPSSSATDRLTGLEVDGTVYEVGGGHKVYTDGGTLLPQEPGLQFASGCVEDDAVNGKTVYIEMIRISQANYDTLKANGQLKPGAKYFIYDAQPVAVNASNLPYSSSKSTKQKIDEQDTVIPLNVESLSTSVTIDVNKCYRVGKRVRVNVVCHSSSNVNGNVFVVKEGTSALSINTNTTGFQFPGSTLSDGLYDTNTTAGYAYLTGQGVITAYIPANKYATISCEFYIN